jgi:hypothetical protein
MKQQTAVEWLLNQLEHQVSDDGKQIMSLKVNGYLREQAKEMEKQQIIEAFKNGDCNGTFETINSEQYYNEKFKNK